MKLLSSAPQPSFTVLPLPSKPELLGVYIKNPDILYSTHGLLSPIPNMPEDTSIIKVNEWNGTAFIGYYDIPLGGRYGIAEIHPIDTKTGRYIEQETYLPSGNYRVVFGVANAADMFPQEMGIGGFLGKCADVGVRIMVTEVENGRSYIIFDKIIRNGKWYDYSVDISSRFSNKRIRVKVESYAAGDECGLWNGEWAVIDYLDIQPY